MHLSQQKCFPAIGETRVSAIFGSAILNTNWPAFVVTLLHAFFPVFSKTLLHTMIRIMVGGCELLQMLQEQLCLT